MIKSKIIISCLVGAVALGSIFNYFPTQLKDSAYAESAQDLEKDFDDVKADAWYYNDVMRAKKLQIISGVGNNKYNPDSTITYAHFLTVVSIMIDPDVTQVESTGNWYDKFVESCRSLGIIGPFEVLPINNPIPREEMIKYTCRALGIVPSTSSTSVFADVTEDLEYAGYINAAYDEYLTEGMGTNDDGNKIFGYGKTATRAQLATMALRIKDYKENKQEYKDNKSAQRAGTTEVERVTVYPGFSIRKEFVDDGFGNNVVPGLMVTYDNYYTEKDEAIFSLALSIDDLNKFPIEPQFKEAHTIIASKYGEEFADEVIALFRQKTEIWNGFGRVWFKKEGRDVAVGGAERSRTVSFTVYK